MIISGYMVDNTPLPDLELRIQYWEFDTRFLLLERGAVRTPFNTDLRVSRRDAPHQCWLGKFLAVQVLGSPIAFYFAAPCYMIVLSKVIEEFNVTAANEKIKNRMRYAQLMAIADTDEQVQQIAAQLFRYPNKGEDFDAPGHANRQLHSDAGGDR